MPVSTRRSRGPLRSLAQWVMRGLLPNQRLKPTREGRGYVLLWIALLAIGLQQQSNLILLTAGFAAGPVVASILISGSMVRRVHITRRLLPYMFEGDALTIDYSLENARRSLAALALVVEDELIPIERSSATSTRIGPRVLFARVPGRSRGRLRWTGTGPSRGRYQFGSLELVSRSPFGLLERRVALEVPGELVVYPQVGQLARRWHQRFRESTETKRGRRYDRTVQQQEYHGLRDYRAGDSPRWIHWRTTARLGQPMVKEFEQQNEQDLAVLLDPWLPRSRSTPEQREAVEEAIRFAATLCLETCRSQGRRLTLGWTGATPGLRQGPASVKLLHEMLEQLAVLRPVSEGQLHQLLDAVPAATLRQAFVVLISTRAINLAEEMDRSFRLSSPTGRGLAGRILSLDVSKGDLADLIQYQRRGSPRAGSTGPQERDGTRTPVPERPASAGPASIGDPGEANR